MVMMMASFALLIFLFFMCSPAVALLLNRLPLPSPLTGPESLAFDRNGEGPYVGVSDGRIMKYSPQNKSFVEYAFTSPIRNKTLCDGLADFSTMQATCGRPLGLRFNHQTGELYAADAYFGLVKVGPNGGAPTQLVGSVLGRPIKFADGLDLDPDSGVVYFTEASANFQLSDSQSMLASRDRSGSLFRYDPSTNQTRVLISGLAVAAGVAVSRDSSFVLVSEYMANRIQRFWLKGPRANTSDTFVILTGAPDNIRRNPLGQFWIAVNNMVVLPPPGTILPTGIRVSGLGFILQVVPLIQEYGIEAVSEVHEFNGRLYTGSLHATYATESVP